MLAPVTGARSAPLRELVRHELVSRQLDAQRRRRLLDRGVLRVLDVGCGTGHQALRLAGAGHQVTGLDPDQRALRAVQWQLARLPAVVGGQLRLLAGTGEEIGRWFGPGSFDLVLCHGVLPLSGDPEALLAALVRVLAPGGVLSLLVPNAAAAALRPGLTWNFPAALDALARPAGMPEHLTREDLVRTLGEMGLAVARWYGVGLFTEAVPDGTPAPHPDQLRVLLDAEDRAGRRDPYRSVAALLHLCGVRE